MTQLPQQKYTKKLANASEHVSEATYRLPSRNELVSAQEKLFFYAIKNTQVFTLRYPDSALAACLDTRSKLKLRVRFSYSVSCQD